MLNAIIGAPLSWLYGLGIHIRHKLFDWKVLKSVEYDIPIVCVGNITVGGTGKTPMVEYLIECLAGSYHVAILSRGYKRKTSGFVLANLNSSYREIGDEPKQIKLKYPDIPVAVCEKRTEGIARLRELYPEINLIILDDAFQHRYVESWVNIILVDYANPIYRDHLLPWGRLRDFPSQMDKAHLVLVTKCPPEMSPLDTRLVKKSLHLFPYQTLYFTRMRQECPQPLFGDEAQEKLLVGSPILALSGIANEIPFHRALEAKFRVVEKVVFSDHHAYRMCDMEFILQKLAAAPPGTMIVTTEKDAVKLTNRKKIPIEIQRCLYYVPVRVTFIGGEKNFLRQLDQYVKTNQKYSVLHPE